MQHCKIIEILRQFYRLKCCIFILYFFSNVDPYLFKNDYGIDSIVIFSVKFEQIKFLVNEKNKLNANKKKVYCLRIKQSQCSIICKYFVFKFYTGPHYYYSNFYLAEMNVFF